MDTVFYRRRCDSRTFYKGPLKYSGELPSFRCTHRIIAATLELLAEKAESEGWKRIEEQDICNRCMKKKHLNGL